MFEEDDMDFMDDFGSNWAIARGRILKVVTQEEMKPYDKCLDVLIRQIFSALADASPGDIDLEALEEIHGSLLTEGVL